jgi:hypothetical protein
MRFGLFGINFGPCADPEVALRVARAAEAADLESVWTGEHVVLPDPQAPPSPVPPQTTEINHESGGEWCAAASKPPPASRCRTLHPGPIPERRAARFGAARFAPGGPTR